MRPNGMKLSYRHRFWFYSSFRILFLSGLLWVFVHYFKSYHNEIGQTTHPAESWALKIHGGAAMFTLVLLGTLIPLHMKKGWKAKINRKTGVILIGTNLILILTGYGLYYVGRDDIRNMTSWIHTVLGIFLPLIIFWHIREGRRLRKRTSHTAHGR